MTAMLEEQGREVEKARKITKSFADNDVLTLKDNLIKLQACLTCDSRLILSRKRYKASDKDTENK